LSEFRFGNCDDYAVGDQITVEVFQPGERVDVTGVSKGKGFAGAQKRHGFRGGPASHGSMSHRRPGSGGATDAARVFKGTKKPGHMGSVRSTVKRLRIHSVDAEKNLLVIEGAVPGPNGQLVTVWQPAGAEVYAAPGEGGE
jgi:large subunit ribosomal protein L3